MYEVMENWIILVTCAGGLVAIIALLGCLYLLRTALIELHTTCDHDYEWPH